MMSRHDYAPVPWNVSPAFASHVCDKDGNLVAISQGHESEANVDAKIEEIKDYALLDLPLSLHQMRNRRLANICNTAARKPMKVLTAHVAAEYWSILMPRASIINTCNTVMIVAIKQAYLIISQALLQSIDASADNIIDGKFIIFARKIYERESNVKSNVPISRSFILILTQSEGGNSSLLFDHINRKIGRAE